MSGLTGFYSLSSKRNSADMRSNLRRMSAALMHRGSDDHSLWLDREAGIALGHQQLAMMGSTPSGSQPMTTPSGRYAIAFDGEIYNQVALRQRLSIEGYCDWQGTSTTETLLVAFTCWGIRRTLQACVGMFAIALWDNKTSRLTLVRDRMGEKPLYYGWMGKTFLFGSELKALQMHQAWNASINREAIACQLHLSYIPAPLTIYQHIYKLEPGHLLQITPHSLPGSPIQVGAWWSLATQIAQTRQAHFPKQFFRNTRKQVDTLEACLSNAVRQQMRADVPVGIFLSGGVNSSLLAALMQTQTQQTLQTFTIAYAGMDDRKANHARAVARHLGAEHHEFYANSVDVRDIIPLLPSVFDEPFSDMAQVPALLMAQLASTKVNVCLSGCGADELFGGYQRYGYSDGYAQRLWKRLQHLPGLLRSTPSQAISEEVVLGICSTPAPIPNHLPERLDFTERLMYRDTLGYLPDNILTKMDRASMGVSLETRAPYLDPRMVELAWQLPLHMKIRHGQGVWLLHQVLERHLPQHLCVHPRQQNSHPPLGDWLRTSLRDWAEALLDASRLRQEGFFDPTPIREKWRQHLAGQYNWQDYLWNLLMFQAWHERQIPVMRAMAA